MVEYRLVRTDEDAAAVYTLAYEYIDWLQERYPEMDGEIDTYLQHQDFDKQVRQVLTFFNPPKGECLLAVHQGSPVGMVMLKDAGDVCKMHRMFVREAGRGLGIGRALVGHLKERAREMGFKSMILNALPRHHEALKLYQSSGFELDDRQGDAGDSDTAILMRMDLESPFFNPPVTL
jgi:GNAT superfamily N-acetyltransferase